MLLNLGQLFQMLIGTSKNELHTVNLLSFGVEKVLSCSDGPVNSVAFPASSHKVIFSKILRLFPEAEVSPVSSSSLLQIETSKLQELFFFLILLTYALILYKNANEIFFLGVQYSREWRGESVVSWKQPTLGHYWASSQQCLSHSGA